VLAWCLQNSSLAEMLRTLHVRYPHPKKILVISAHWEDEPLKVTSGIDHAPFTYGYFGFPPHCYSVPGYEPKGHPKFAKRVRCVRSVPLCVHVRWRVPAHAVYTLST
jgi:4,5-DOPA dioxygenase extradiol